MRVATMSRGKAGHWWRHNQGPRAEPDARDEHLGEHKNGQDAGNVAGAVLGGAVRPVQTAPTTRAFGQSDDSKDKGHDA